MPLNKEWHHRIHNWEQALWQTCYRPLGELSLSGFTTSDHLSSIQALEQRFLPMPPGTQWGAKWEYGWFKSILIVPPEAAGQRLVLSANPADHSPESGECLVWVNGEIAGSFSWVRQHLTVTKSAVPGTQYKILIEAYAGHGPLVFDGGPVPHGSVKVPESPLTQVTVRETTFGIWREEIYQLAVDFSTLYDLSTHLEPLSLRAAEVDQGLMDATLLVDPELPEQDYISSASLARERLRPLLACTNGSSAPVLYAFGHAHIDIAWLWPLAETKRKIARTIANQLDLFQEYPEYRFLQSQPHLYMMLKENYPELYVRLKAAIHSGQVIADGAMWVEADTNLSGGESLIRHILNGKRFFQEELGVESDILWLPDVFGYSGALPQILRGCGIKGFATQKITWAYHGGEPFPYNTFLWEGIDGSTIPAHIFTDYNSQTRPSALLERWNTRLQTHGLRSMILAFGWGDGGGGPTRDHLEFLRRATDLEGVPRLKMASPAEFFADLPAQDTLPRYVGELYFQAHRGTYTSQARTKRLNRMLELSLREAEFWGSLASVLTGYEFSNTTLQTSWRTLLLHQFHDILPGSSIQRVYQEAETTLTSALHHAVDTAHLAASSWLSTATGQAESPSAYTLFNSLSWPRTVIADLPSDRVEVTIPACGWTTVHQDARVLDMPSVDGMAFGTGTQIPARASHQQLENEHLLARFNQDGELINLILKSTGWEVMSSPGNRLCLFKDVPSYWDAWDVDSMAEMQLVNLSEPGVLEVIDPGPLVAQLRFTRLIGLSLLSQTITLRRGSHRLEFATEIDWQENHKLLKVAFPVTVHATEAIHEIQFGYIRRPTHRSRQFDADRFEVCNHKWTALAEELRGVAILNDCKYGLSVDQSIIKLTLLKSALAPDPLADRGSQVFTYAIYPWQGPLAGSRLVQEAYELNIPPLILPGSTHENSIIEISSSNVILETIKPAEDGSGDLILRLYESMHTTTECTLSMRFPIQDAWQTNLLEKEPLPIQNQDGMIALNFRPFEIKTVRIQLSSRRSTFL